ncbi:MAG: GtrA family protein, partial [Candidatus Acidiferrales bacterium]
RVSIRYLKSAAVGGTGILFNLVVMALLLTQTRIHDWRASASASFAASVQNYFLMAVWSPAQGMSKGLQRLGDYLSYLLMSAAGLVAATAAYEELAWSVAQTHLLHAAASAFYTRLFCQLAAVLFGIGFNYVLTRGFDGPDLCRLQLQPPVKATLLR